MTGEESYQLLAEHYDAIHDSKPYAREADFVLELLDERLDGQGMRLLGMACGTGRHIAEFTDRFDCVGVDANAGMLELARQRVPEATFVQADMRSVALDERFDALTCLFGSIGYLVTWPNLERAVESFASHLREGGAFVIETWLPPEELATPTRRVRSYEGPERSITRLARAEPAEDGVSHLDIHWLIGEGDEPIRHHAEEQQLGVFGVERTVNLLAKHGLEAEVVGESLTEERVLLAGRRV